MAKNHPCVLGSRSPFHPHGLYRNLIAGFAVLTSLMLAPAASADGPLPGQFDNYELTLSWSPTYCESKAGQDDDRQHCGPDSANVFVVHGLRPQYKQGWLKDCTLREKRVPNAVVDSILDIMPSKKLIDDEWKKYGGCSGLKIRAYFDLMRNLFSKLRIPARYKSPQKAVVTTPEQLVADFIKANRDLTPDMLSVQCGDSRDKARLVELRICFGKDGSFQSCRANEAQQCRAKQVVLPSARKTAPAFTAKTAPAFTTKYVYYKISGDSAAGVYLSMLRRGPHVKGSKAYAATSAESSQSGKLELKNSCRVTDYQYSVDFVIRLPKLTNEASLSPSARARWQQFSGFLRKHEETHRAIWMECAHEIEAKVKAVRGRSCEEADQKAQAIREQVQKACNRKHIAFDAAEQKRLAKHPFVKMVLSPTSRPVKMNTTTIASKKRKKSAALFKLD